MPPKWLQQLSTPHPRPYMPLGDAEAWAASDSEGRTVESEAGTLDDQESSDEASDCIELNCSSNRCVPPDPCANPCYIAYAGR